MLIKYYGCLISQSMIKLIRIYRSHPESLFLFLILVKDQSIFCTAYDKHILFVLCMTALYVDTI